jgi:hypothetical protein
MWEDARVQAAPFLRFCERYSLITGGEGAPAAGP